MSQNYFLIKDTFGSDKSIYILNSNQGTVFRHKLLAIMAHDVKGPIAVMHQTLELINKSLYDLEKKDLNKFLIRFEKDLSNITSMLDNLLIWANNQDNLINVNNEKLILKDVVEEVIDILSIVSTKKQIDLYNLVDNNVLVYTDKQILKIILHNLISNAIKFSHPLCDVKIETDIIENVVNLKIKDNGIGIDSVTIEKILSDDIFSSYGTYREKGIGLGINICKDFLAQLETQLEIESQVQIGSTFSFKLPIAQN